VSERAGQPEDRNGVLHCRSTIIHAPCPVMVYAEDGQVLQVNDHWTQLSGYAPEDLPTVADWYRAAQPTQSVPSRIDLEALFESDERLDEGEQPVRASDGTELIWDFSSAPLGLLPDGRRAVLRMATDVTADRCLTRALWGSNTVMHGILESIGDAFIAMDRGWRLVYLNEHAERLLDVRREEADGQLVWDLLGPEERALLEPLADQAMRQQRRVQTDLAVAGSERWLHVRLYPASDGLSMFLQDVSERVRMQEDLRRTTQKLKAIIQAAPIGVIALDANRHITLWSPGAQKIYGWSEEEVVGREPPSVPASEQPAYQAMAERAIRTGQPQIYEARRQTKDGRPIDVQVWATALFDSEGALEGAMAIHADITQRRQDEEALHRTKQQLEQIVAACPCAIIVLDTRGVVQQWNPAAEAMFGYSAAEATGRPLAIVPATNADMYGRFRQMVAEGRGLDQIIVPCSRKDGSQIMTNMTIAPVLDAQGTVINLLGILWEVAPQSAVGGRPAGLP
jgi:PAS domain S-box-containing protein